MRTTIKDVARKAGVSPATVSLVLNNKPVSISAQTREAVLQAAKELRYRPNQLAVGLVTNKTNVIGLIIPDNANPYFATLANKIEREASKNGYSVILGNADNDPKRVRNHLRIFADHGVDGIILAQSDFSSLDDSMQCMDLLLDLKIPITLVDRVCPTKHHQIHSIIVDQEQIGYIATKHLLIMGHRKIGCVSGPNYINNCSGRLIGYKKALAEYDIPFDQNLIYEEELNIQTGVHSLPTLLGQGVTAIFAFNDLIAYGIYKELRNYNLSIPDDLSIIGVDDIFFSEILQPPLTTIEQPVDAMAKQVVTHMVSQINEPTKSLKPTIFTPILKARGSVKKININS